MERTVCFGNAKKGRGWVWGELAERKRKPNRGGVKFLFELLPDSFFLISDVAIQAGRHNMRCND